MSDKFVVLSLKEILIFFSFVSVYVPSFSLRQLLHSVSLRRLLHSVYTVDYRWPDTMCELLKHDQCSHLGKTSDALIIGDNF